MNTLPQDSQILSFGTDIESGRQIMLVMWNDGYPRKAWFFVDTNEYISDVW